MGTELTGLLNRLRKTWDDVLRNAKDQSTFLPGEVDAFADELDQCIALSQQPPVYAMSREGEMKRWQQNLPTEEELSMSAKDMLSSYIRSGRVMTLSALESMFGKVEAPSPQAVTVEGLMDVVEKWYSDSPLMPMPHSTQYDDLRTRLDQYLNNR